MYLSQTLFKLTALVTTIFVITILAMVAMLLGDPDAPVNVWFNRHGATVMTVEVLAIGLFGMSSMIADRNEMLREQKKKQDDKPD
jgi:succinate dehydrogenase hydrophobic anchor subunit